MASRGLDLVCDSAKVPWVALSSAIVSKLMFEGPDGPQARHHKSLDPKPVAAHYHSAAQFQMVVNGAMEFPDHRLEPLGLHYADCRVAYGPFQGYYEFLVLRPRPVNIVWVSDAEGRKKINRTGREIICDPGEVSWEPLPGHSGARQKVLIPKSAGPYSRIVECTPNMELECGPAPYGRFYYVTGGSVTIGEASFGAGALRYVEGEDKPLRSGPDGATIAVLTFDQGAEAV